MVSERLYDWLTTSLVIGPSIDSVSHLKSNVGNTRSGSLRSKDHDGMQSLKVLKMAAMFASHQTGLVRSPPDQWLYGPQQSCSIFKQKSFLIVHNNMQGKNFNIGDLFIEE
eukprot:Gb_28888 [translate_table: standard]